MRECGVRVNTVVSFDEEKPLVVQCKVELESTVASLRHILISPGVWKGTVPVRREGRSSLRAESVAGAQACLLT